MKTIQMVLKEDVHWALKKMAVERQVTVRGLLAMILEQTLTKHGYLAKKPEPQRLEG